MNDREWDIFMLEVEARDDALITEFLVSKMRPRDFEQLEQEQNGIETEAGGIPGQIPAEG